MTNFFSSFLFRGLCLASLFFFTACTGQKNISRDFSYFQKGLDSLGSVNFKEPTIQPNDLLDIFVFSKSINQEQATLFNLPNTSIGSGHSRNSAGYLVNANGTIELPFVGSLQAAGLTRAQLSSTLATKLTPYVKEPTVLVRYMQFRVNVMGEVKNPGNYNFPTDRVTLLDALSMAGDLTDFGKRTNIMVIREEAGARKYYPVNLNSGSVFQSPAFQLQQNDIIYVQANTRKMNDLDENPKAQRNTQLGFAIASFAVLLANLIITIRN
jgi:polysaccharide export outer membrane protein